MNRACTSSLHTVADAVKEIAFGHPSIVLAGVELNALTRAYCLFTRGETFSLSLNKAFKTNQQRFNILKKFKLSHWIPVHLP